MRRLVEELQQIEDGLRDGGGAAKVDKQHRDGKLTARERIARLIDPGSMFLEIGLLIAYDLYDGQAPAAGVVTGIARIENRPAVIVANDATVKAGAWWPETITKILRAQEIAMRNRLPIVYLVDSAGVNLPLQDGIFPGQYGAARIFYYNSLMRRKLRIPQISAVMGPCIAGGAYLPALSDVIIMVQGTSFMGLGGPNLVKGAIGQATDTESLGGESMHTRTSGVAHYSAKDDADCLAIIRRLFRELPPPRPGRTDRSAAKPIDDLYELMPDDHRAAVRHERSGRAHSGFRRVPGISTRPRAGVPVRECADLGVSGCRHREPARISEDFRAGRGSEGSSIPSQPARLPILSRTRSASGRRCCTSRTSPALWWAWKPRRKASSGRAPIWWRQWRARRYRRSSSRSIMPAARAITRWPGRASIRISHSLGRPRGSASWRATQPSKRFTVPNWTGWNGKAKRVPEDLQERIEKTRADYERWLDAKYAAARGHLDALIDPLATRRVLAFALEATSYTRHSEHLVLETMS